MIFINYFREDERDSPINVAASRTIIGVYLIWKILSYEWRAIATFPIRLRDLWMVLHPAPLRDLVIIEKWLLIILLIGFILGYRLGITSFLSALLTTHLASLMWTLTASGQTTSMFIATYFIIFFGLFRDQDVLTADGLRRTGGRSIEGLNRHLKSDGRDSYRMSALKWSLVALGLIYFGTGFDKFVRTPVTTWIQTENLARILVYRRELYHTAKPVAEFFLAYPILIDASTIGTLVLELGFLPAILIGAPITPFILMFAGMHAVIALAMGPFFFDLYLFYLLFLPWDTIHRMTVADRPVDLVYDERCHFCARSLHFAKLLDVTGSIRFYSQSDLPERYRNIEGVDYESEIYLYRDGTPFSGYSAFRELFRQFGILRPFGLLMSLPIVEPIGKQVYSYIATHRDRHFTCEVDFESSTTDAHSVDGLTDEQRQ